MNYWSTSCHDPSPVKISGHALHQIYQPFKFHNSNPSILILILISVKGLSAIIKHFVVLHSRDQVLIQCMTTGYLPATKKVWEAVDQRYQRNYTFLHHFCYQQNIPPSFFVNDTRYDDRARLRKWWSYWFYWKSPILPRLARSNVIFIGIFNF